MQLLCRQHHASAVARAVECSFDQLSEGNFYSAVMEGVCDGAALLLVDDTAGRSHSLNHKGTKAVAASSVLDR